MDLIPSWTQIARQIEASNDWIKAILLVGVLLGAVLLALVVISLLWLQIKFFRLYIWSQLRGGADLVRKYGEWIVITGATDGIGYAMAHEFARRGHSIIAVGRNKAKLQATKESLVRVQNVGQVETIEIDLSDQSVENFEVVKQHLTGRAIGILINNAGFYTDTCAHLINFDMADLLTMVNVNLVAALHMTRTVLPSMIKHRKGLIINTSSILSPANLPYTAVYGPTKLFTDSLSRRLEKECSKFNVDFVSLRPGPVNTQMYRKAGDPDSTPFIITAEQYAKTAINALATGINVFSGCFFHEMIQIALHVGDYFQPLQMMIIYLTGCKREYEPQFE